MYTKLVKELETLGVRPIVTPIGSEPDLRYHAPISTESVTDDAKKGKIIKEVQQGYLYTHGDHEHIILPATVVVGA